MSQTPSVIFWSGGKDAAMALCELRGTGDVAALLTTYDETSGQVPFQSLTIGAIRSQAQALGLPLVEVALPAAAPNEVYVERVLEALSREVGDSANDVVFGDIYLDDIRAWREQMFCQTPYSTVFPLWHRATDELARSFLAGGFRAVVSTVDTRALPAEVLGTPYDEVFVNGLPDDVDPCGERGEFHTVVWDGPGFAQPLEVVPGERMTNGAFASIEIDLQPRWPT